jgi:hydroxyethylthiazole kinase-like uncharacterized protein yjeF
MERRGYSAAQVRAAEAPLLASGEPLMRRAASALATEVRRELARRVPDAGVPDAGVPDAAGRVLLLVGSGDNGGDTLYAGAELAASGIEVLAVQVGSTLRQDAASAALDAGVVFASPQHAASLAARSDIVLDGILGIGATPPLRGAAREVVAAILPLVTATSAPLVIAVDLPSGIHPDDGSAPDAVVLPAAVTVTFGAEKAGLLRSPGRELAGEVRLIDLGLRPALDRVEPLAHVRADDIPD